MRGKVALVTGAGSGIGRATVERLAARGCRVACGDLNLAGAEAAAAAGRRAGGEVLVDGLDVVRKESVRAFVSRALDAFGRVDCLVNCAGVWEHVPLADLEEAAWDRVVDVNLKGTFLCCQAVCGPMREQGAGAIVNIASVAGRMGGNLCGAHYAASKGGVVALTMNLARELGPAGIRVNAIAPGIIDTPMTATWPAEVMAGIVARTPLGRLGRPDDIADAIVYLLSDEARFINGETLEVNGGLFTH